MDITEMYSRYIITPIEIQVKALRKKVYKRFSLTKAIDKANLEKTERLLYEYYEKFAILIDNETNSNKNELSKIK